MMWKPVNYEDLVPVIQKALDELETTPLSVTPRQILEVLSGDSPIDPVDDACRFFARTGLVRPELPADVRLAMSFRLRCARWYCHDLKGGCEDETAEEILMGILTDYWEDVGRFDWLQEDVLAGDYDHS
jgi:hypothetical protein